MYNKSMKTLILILLILPSFSYAGKITIKEAIVQCDALDQAARSQNNLCQKLDARLKQIKEQSSQSKANPVKPVSSTNPNIVNTKQEKIKSKCEQLGNEKMLRHKLCRPYLTVEPDPILGDKNNLSARYSFSLGYNILGNLNGPEFEFERRSNKIGLGLFYSQQTISDLDENKITGSAYGLVLKYHFLPLSYSQKFDFSLFSQVGLTKYESQSQGTLPTYFYNNTGLEISKSFSNNFEGFAKVGVVNIYHSESDFLNMGATGTLGIKFGF